MKHAIVCGICAAVLACATATAKERPNLIIINIDNHDKGSLSYFGNTFIETPNIDTLFEQGLRLQHYATAGRCTSSRSALITGRYHARNGALGTGAAWGQSASAIKTIGEVFKQAGYQTSLFGKWHMGDSHGLRPEDRGFDEVCSFENGAYLSGAVVTLGYNRSDRTAESYRFNHNGNYETYEGFRTDIWVDEINKYLEFKRDKNKPFFMYFATITAHGPCFGPEDLQAYYKTKYEKDEYQNLRDRYVEASKKNAPKGRNALVCYPYDHAADVASLDRNIGRLMAKLKELDLQKTTIIVYMSDGSGSGPASADRKEIHSDTVSQNPTTILLPGRSEGLDIEGPLVANIDILPTFAEICAIDLSEDLKNSIDGQSFASLLGVANAVEWEPRPYINDHQSTGERAGIAFQMVLKPYNATRVTLPNGKSVSWKSGKVVKANGMGPETVSLAREAYDKWLERVVRDFPLGAYVQTHDSDKPVFLRSYPIVDGPGGKGVQLYFLLDVLSDGAYEFDTNVSDYFGAERVAPKGITSGTLTAFKKSVEGHLPVGFDDALGVYRVLPKTLAASFEQEDKGKVNSSATLKLKAGRYVIHFENEKASTSKKTPKMKIRVQKALGNSKRKGAKHLHPVNELVTPKGSRSREPSDQVTSTNS